jgi:hypothetical protein
MGDRGGGGGTVYGCHSLVEECANLPPFLARQVHYYADARVQLVQASLRQRLWRELPKVLAVL